MDRHFSTSEDRGWYWETAGPSGNLWRVVSPKNPYWEPILFLFYVNDMPTQVQNTAKMFADDTKLYAKTKTRHDCDHLQQDLNHLAAWSQEWLLQFNETKCVILKIRESLKYAYTLNGYNLKQEMTQNDLGVTTSDNLKPATHIQEIVKKANQRIGIIKRCFTRLTQTKVQTLYHTIVRPILEYGRPVWNPNLVKDINYANTSSTTEWWTTGIACKKMPYPHHPCRASN